MALRGGYVESVDGEDSGPELIIETQAGEAGVDMYKLFSRSHLKIA